MKTRNRVTTWAAFGGGLLLLAVFFVTGGAGTPPLFCDPASAVSQHLRDLGFKGGDFVVNPNIENIPKDAEMHTRGGGAFSDEGAYTIGQLEAYLDSSSGNAALLREEIGKSLDGSEAAVPVYFHGEIDVLGNKGVVNGQVEDFGTRESGAGELIWFFVNEMCEVEDVIVRAGCINPGEGVRPPCREEEGCEPECPNGLCPKDRANDPPGHSGFTQIFDLGPETDGQESERQHENGEVEGNVIDNQVPQGTQSGDTTSDTGDTVTVGGAGDADDEITSDDVTDDSVTVDDDGGTGGATKISEPAD